MMVKVEVEQINALGVPITVWGEDSGVILLASGAGALRDGPTMSILAEKLVCPEFSVVTFDYPYLSERRRFPDPVSVLMETHRKVWEWCRKQWDNEVVLAGRSMGGRIASMLVAEGIASPALVLYSYPLHPVSHPDQLRIEHLPQIRTPTLIIQGTKDPMSRPELFERHLQSHPQFTTELIEGGDHSFRGAGLGPAKIAEKLASLTHQFLEDQVS